MEKCVQLCQFCLFLKLFVFLLFGQGPCYINALLNLLLFVILYMILHCIAHSYFLCIQQLLCLQAAKYTQKPCCFWFQFLPSKLYYGVCAYTLYWHNDPHHTIHIAYTGALSLVEMCGLYWWRKYGHPDMYQIPGNKHPVCHGNHCHLTFQHKGLRLGCSGGASCLPAELTGHSFLSSPIVLTLPILSSIRVLIL